MNAKTRAFFAATFASVALAGCASGQLTPAAQSKVAAVYAEICPPVTSGAFDPLAAKFNANVQAAYATAKTICANGVPTDAATAALDLLAVEPLLAPYLAKTK